MKALYEAITLWMVGRCKFVLTSQCCPGKKLSGVLPRLSWRIQVIPAQNFMMATARMIFDDLIIFLNQAFSQEEHWRSYALRGATRSPSSAKNFMMAITWMIFDDLRWSNIPIYPSNFQGRSWKIIPA